MKKIFIWSILCLSAIMVQADKITARQKFFNTVEADPAAAVKYLADNDVEIRRYALYRVIKADPAKNIAAIARAAGDPEDQIRLIAVMALAKLTGSDPQVMSLLQKIAAQEKNQQIRQIAVAASWPFHRTIKLLRNDPAWDYEVKVIKTLPLEKLPWLFTLDPQQNGHLQGFFKPDMDTSGWKPVKMGFWEHQGFADYNGAAWYQIKFVMPPKMDCNAVEIAFEAVDEAAWVWLNGKYLGAHDVGPEGWREPFAVDCTSEVLWGKENVLTIRVYDAAFAGGIYRPLRVEILK